MTTVVRPGLLVATWALAALVATGVALGSVRLVAEQVAGRPRVLTPETVAALAASAAPVSAPAAAAPPAPALPEPVSGAPAAPPAPEEAAAAPPPAPATSGRAGGTRSRDDSPGGSGLGPAVPGRGPSTALPAPGDTARPRPVAPAPVAPPAGAPPAPPAGPPPADPAPAPSARTVTAVGGTLAVACEGTRPVLVYATPTAGFASDVRDSGDSLEVRFRGEEEESRVRVVCAGGSPSAEVEERD